MSAAQRYHRLRRAHRRLTLAQVHASAALARSAARLRRAQHRLITLQRDYLRRTEAFSPIALQASARQRAAAHRHLIDAQTEHDRRAAARALLHSRIRKIEVMHDHVHRELMRLARKAEDDDAAT